MKIRTFFPIFLAFALALPAAAQTPQPPYGTRYESESQFTITLGETVSQFAGIDIRETGDNEWIFDFCADFAAGINSSSYYDLSDGLGDISAKQAQIDALLAHTLPNFNNLVVAGISDTGTWPTGAAGEPLRQLAAAIQLALWDIIHDDDLTLSSGTFSVAASADPGLSESVAQAEAFLANIANSTWLPGSDFTYQYARPTTDTGTPVPDGQDRLWVAIPEPAASLLGALGLLGLLRRRRP